MEGLCIFQPPSDDILMLHQMGEQLARGQPSVWEDDRQKPDGGVRGIVAGDILRSGRLHGAFPVRPHDTCWD